MLAETGLLLALERPSLPPRAAAGGFLTPASACGARLRERLHERGIAFEALDLSMLPGSEPRAKL